MGIPLPPRGLQIDSLYGARGQLPLAHEGQIALQLKKAMCVALFTNHYKESFPFQPMHL